MAALTILDLSKVNVGLPSMERSLGADPSALQLIVAGYALAFGLTLVPAGRLGDLYSRKAMFLIGLGTFTGASALCALAPDVVTLVAARAMQGMAAGMLMPQVLGLIQQLFPPTRRGRAFGLFGATVSVATAIGPTLGGLLILVAGSDEGWRWMFWMNVPLGAVALAFAAWLLPSTRSRPADPRDLDPIGVLLLGTTIVGVMAPFVLTTGGFGDSPERWIWLGGAAVSLCAFVVWERAYERRGKTPAIRLALFRVTSFRNGLLVATAWFGAMPAVFLLSILYLQQGAGYPPVLSGTVGITFAMASAAASVWGGRFVAESGRVLVVVGLLTAGAGFTLTVFAVLAAPHEWALAWMAAALALAGAGGGLVISANQTLTLSDVPVSSAGVAGSMTQVGQRVGTAIGIAGAGAAYYATLGRDGDGDGAFAFRDGAMVSITLVAIACVIALVDLLRRR
ncbi:MFS transporter [Herbiconiux sp. SALV-R1]|nr:MFS transporter [Herbiconiux sp. SALV-R1]